jgi:hypothetical protein
MEKNKSNSVVIGIIIVLIIIVLGFVWIWHSNPNASISENPTSTTTLPTQPSSGGSTVTTSTTTLPGAPIGFDKSFSDGTIHIAFPTSQFALATDPSQITDKSYIPPCDQGFAYCLYYNGTAYSGTNFESAGIAISPKANLTTQTKCLQTQPAGYTGLKSTSGKAVTLPGVGASYITSVFSPIGDAAAGHFATGAVYRLAYQENATTFDCYEFDTQIGQTDFYNYPTGAINQFTVADQTTIQAELTKILTTLTLPSGQYVLFPTAATSTNG